TGPGCAESVGCPGSTDGIPSQGAGSSTLRGRPPDAVAWEARPRTHGRSWGSSMSWKGSYKLGKRKALRQPRTQGLSEGWCPSGGSRPSRTTRAYRIRSEEHTSEL